MDAALIDATIERHQKVLLSLSSGKDSTACLWLLEKHWPKITVAWVNMGDPYPETVEHMNRIRSLVPHFEEIKGNQQEWVRQNGFPVDLVPLENTRLGRAISGYDDGPMLSSTVDCCWANFWLPLANFVHDHGITLVIRGQKTVDQWKSPIKSGDRYDGVEYLFPIEDWTDEQVHEFLKDRIPDSYKRGLPSSLDCMTCTGYAKHCPGRIADLAQINPQKAELVRAVHQYLRFRVVEEIRKMDS